MNALQTNGHDCGLWVLFWIAVILRGFNFGGPCVKEEVMSSWRSYLGKLVRNLSVC